MKSIMPHVFLLQSVLVKNANGLFLCRSNLFGTIFIHQKYIRSHQKNPEGLYAPGMQQGGPPNMPQQMMAQEMVSSIHPADPRYSSHQNSMHMQGGMQQGMHMQQGMQQPVVEDYKEISIREVASRIFPSVPSFIDALDDQDNQLHNVAISFLESGKPSSV